MQERVLVYRSKHAEQEEPEARRKDLRSRHERLSINGLNQVALDP